MKIIFLQSSNFDELHQLVKDITAFEIEANQFMASLVDKHYDDLNQRKADLHQKGLELHGRVHAIFPTDESHDEYAKVKGAVLGLIGTVVIIVGALLAVYLPPVAVGLAVISGGIVAAACGKGFFATAKPPCPYEPYHSDTVLNSINNIVETTLSWA